MRWPALLVLLAACDGSSETVAAVEICDNLRDDDGDTLIDCADADCVGSCPENCVDALDNDGDGDVDCADADCDGLCPEDCTDDRDNDGDLLIDCNDTDCLGFCPEDCNDGVDNDGDGLFDCVDPDCADPSCPELCTDNADNDGDGLVDCDDPSCDGSCTERCMDLRDNDGDGFTDCEDVDCDGECPEHCTDGRDNDGDGVFDCEDPDCDGQCDQDGDGYLDAAGGGLDCDDTNASIHPFAREICNAADDDCDGLEDEADPSLDPATLFTFFPDLDGDGYGDDSAASGQGCVPPSGAVTIGGDCADGNPARNPAALEVCDLIDNDCDELTDDADPDIDPALQQTWYADVDGDGFGDAADTVQSCLPPSGYVGNGLDCHVFDARYTITQDWWPDLDGDGFGAGAPTPACIGPSGHVANADDCDDTDPELSPDTRWHRDADLDGFGSATLFVTSCTPVPGYLRDDRDCDDTSFAIKPGTIWQLDGDGDGFGDPLLTVEGCDPVEGHTFDDTDCDDGNPFTYPGAPELCDLEDNDCDTVVDENAIDLTWYLDLDGDGAGRTGVSVTQCEAPPAPASLLPGDCDDTDPLLNLDDADGDGVHTCAGDCNDADPLIHPGAPDPLGDGIDQDCDGLDGSTRRSCKEWHDADPGLPSGVYSIEPTAGGSTYDVYCDMSTNGGGWTLVASTRSTTLNDERASYYSDLQTLSPSGGHTGVWDGMRPVAMPTSDLRFACKRNTSDANMTVDLTFFDVIWYGEITTGSDSASCFSEGNGAGADPPPRRRDNLTSTVLPAGDNWNAGFLEGEDSCSSTDDFTVDFDDRGMDSTQDSTDWGEDDGFAKCGTSSGQMWFIFVR